VSTREPRRDGSLQEKLDQVFRQTGLSHRQLARLMTGSKATQRQVDTLRSQISKWRNKPGVGVSAPNSARLAGAFSKAGLILPADYFLSEPVQRDEIADLRRRIEELEQRIS
jgi:phage shock protein A